MHSVDAVDTNGDGAVLERRTGGELGHRRRHQVRLCLVVGNADLVHEDRRTSEGAIPTSRLTHLDRVVVTARFAHVARNALRQVATGDWNADCLYAASSRRACLRTI